MLNNKRAAGRFGKRDYYHQLDAICDGIGDEILEALLKKCKIPNLYFFCSTKQLPQLLNFAERNKLNFNVLAWHKTNPTPTCNNTYLSDTEFIVFMRGNGAKVFGSVETKAQYFLTPTNKDDKNVWHHPTIKPLKIIRTLIHNSSQPGDIVFDPYIGSGTTAVAAIQLGRQYIGAEISPEYYKIAQQRIALEKSQTKLDL